MVGVSRGGSVQSVWDGHYVRVDTPERIMESPSGDPAGPAVATVVSFEGPVAYISS